MPELIVMCGPAGSGKSSWAREYVKRHDNFYIVSTDEIRKALLGDETDQSNPQKIFAFAHMKIYYYLSHGRNVIFDAMNLRAKDRRAIIKKYRPIENMKFDCVVCSTPCKECKNRQTKRKRKVDDSVIDNQFRNFQIPSAVEGWNYIHKQNHKEPFTDIK